MHPSNTSQISSRDGKVNQRTPNLGFVSDRYAGRQSDVPGRVYPS